MDSLKQLEDSSDDEIQVQFQPYKMKVVENIRISTKEERIKWIENAGYNLYNLQSDQIMIDLLTDSGICALSQNQASKLLTGDESYAGSTSFFNFKEAVQELTNYKHVIPVHQGRGAEKILFSVICNENTIIPNNAHFLTTRLNIELTNSSAVDLISAEAKDMYFEAPFKGNMNIEKLEALLKESADKIPLVMLTITNNIIGGNPVSMENIRQTQELCKRFNKPLFYDACRFAENAYLIKKREKGYENKSIKEICQEMFNHADGMIMSAKKDGLSHIGGWIALNNDELATQIEDNLFISEGFKTYGGMAGRDLDIVAEGLKEVIDYSYLNHRFEVNERLIEQISQMNIPVLKPVCGHAIFIDAKAYLPHIPCHEYPAQALCIAIYIEGGIRTCEIGSLSSEHATIELVRFCIPRKVYSEDQLNHVVKTLKKIKTNKEKLTGYKLIKCGKVFRQFTAVIEKLSNNK